MTSSVTANPVSAKPRRMPKEKLPDVMTVRFAEGTFERVDAAAGKNRRAKFVREAVEEKLAKPKRATPRKPADP